MLNMTRFFPRLDAFILDPELAKWAGVSPCKVKLAADSRRLKVKRLDEAQVVDLW